MEPRKIHEDEDDRYEEGDDLPSDFATIFEALFPQLVYVEVLELPYDENIYVIDCEIGEELVNVENFSVHDEPVDEKQPCYAIEIYDDPLKEAEVGKIKIDLTRAEPVVGMDFDGGFEADLPEVHAGQTDVEPEHAKYSEPYIEPEQTEPVV
ncbi:unnamed protein product [Fraxinus pennsylvanica]|uniref:Uncharacterized protein n=1 Tax=Fraxinus pennsylvanica TaxID=56036 RepID=A0AAD2A5F1_9LAMI|nr:unnamed protein product [Fraxinus pennsylvanica]